jgi:hypothetical protein
MKGRAAWHAVQKKVSPHAPTARAYEGSDLIPRIGSSPRAPQSHGCEGNLAVATAPGDHQGPKLRLVWDRDVIGELPGEEPDLLEDEPDLLPSNPLPEQKLALRAYRQKSLDLRENPLANSRIALGKTDSWQQNRVGMSTLSKVDSRALSSARSDPFFPGRGEDHEVIYEVFARVVFEEGCESIDDVARGRWMNLQADDTRMQAQRQNGPITEVLIQGDENTTLRDGKNQDLLVVRSRLTRL